MLRIFSSWKIRRLRPGSNPRTWVPAVCMLDHRNRTSYCYLFRFLSVATLSGTDGRASRLFQEARHTGLHLFCTLMNTRPSVLPKFPVVHCESICYTTFYCFFSIIVHRFVCPAKYGFQCTVFVIRRNAFDVMFPILNTSKKIISC
jgi:hypothetical protein